MVSFKVDPFIGIALIYLTCSAAIALAGPDLRGVVPERLLIDVSRFDSVHHRNPFISIMPSYHLIMGAMFVPVAICNYILLSSRLDRTSIRSSAREYVKLSVCAFLFMGAMIFVMYSSFDPGESISTRSRLIFSVVYGSRVGLSIFMFIIYWISAVMVALGFAFLRLSSRA